MAEPAEYRVATERVGHGEIKYSAMGPGLGNPILLLDTQEQAEMLCRYLERAYAAGQHARSLQLKALLDDTRDYR